MRKKLLFLLASLVASLVLAEFTVRIFLPAPQRVVHGADDGAGKGADKGTIRLKTHVEEGGLYYTTPTGRRLRPNAHVIIENHVLGGRRIDIRTNSLGYRNREIGPKTDRPRVLFLGDSITWGDYLHEPETFVRQIEHMSEKTERPLETVNAAIGAIGIQSELAILRETGLGIHPDVVVLCFYLNDAQPSRMRPQTTVPSWLSFSRLAYCVARALPRLGLGPRERKRARFDAEFEQTMRREIAKLYPAGPGDPLLDTPAFNARIAARVRDWGSAWSPTAQARIHAALREFHALSQQHGFEFKIVAFPVLLQVQAKEVHDQPQRWLEGIARQLGVPCLDLLPALRRAYRTSTEKLYYDHCHNTPAGNIVVAREILPFLQGP